MSPESSACSLSKEISETFDIRKYLFYSYKVSELDPDQIIRDEMFIICPRCKQEQACPDFGEKRRCVNCDLLMHNHGAELICSL